MLRQSDDKILSINLNITWGKFLSKNHIQTAVEKVVIIPPLKIQYWASLNVTQGGRGVGVKKYVFSLNPFFFAEQNFVFHVYCKFK